MFLKWAKVINDKHNRSFLNLLKLKAEQMTDGTVDCLYGEMIVILDRMIGEKYRADPDADVLEQQYSIITAKKADQKRLCAIITQELYY